MSGGGKTPRRILGIISSILYSCTEPGYCHPVLYINLDPQMHEPTPLHDQGGPRKALQELVHVFEGLGCCTDPGSTRPLHTDEKDINIIIK